MLHFFMMRAMSLWEWLTLWMTMVLLLLLLLRAGENWRESRVQSEQKSEFEAIHPCQPCRLPMPHDA
jgi:hypothetical protein